MCPGQEVHHVQGIAGQGRVDQGTAVQLMVQVVVVVVVRENEEKENTC